MSAEPRVTAIIAAYNEADIIAPVVEALIAEGTSVYLIDNGSTDGTSDAARPFLGRGLIDIERLDTSGADGGAFSWTAILERKRELAMQLEGDWFIHHDADEFRESLWEGLSLRDAIGRVDRLGWNAIDFEVIDFRPTGEEFVPGTDPRPAFRYFEPGGMWDKAQVKCWKRSPQPPDLVSSGGHDVMFPGRRVFPLRFILRHYPIRGPRHGRRKVFSDRRPRLRDAERALGWHVQYDHWTPESAFSWDPRALTEYDPIAVRVAALGHHRGVDDLADRVDALADVIVRREDAIRTLQRHLANLHARVEELEAEVQRRGEALTELRRVEADLRQALAEHHDQIVHLGGEIEALRGSLSWRVTEPLRAASRLVRRD